ncbi:MAG: DASS family sodium-coupled anion symporter [Saprospiraceae bacterium]
MQTSSTYTPNWIPLILGPLAFTLIYLFLRPEGLSLEAVAAIACIAWISIWWVTEAIPIGMTSLLPLILFPLSGALDMKMVAQSYGNPVIFLFIGGFMVALAIEQCGLHKRLALHFIKAIGLESRKVVLSIMLFTGFLSMWISNTATAVMMFPIGMSLIAAWPQTDELNRQQFAKVIMLGIAYAASIGGIGTLIGTPTNMIMVGAMKELYGFKIDFITWAKIGVPLAVGMLFLGWFFMVHVMFKLPKLAFEGNKHLIDDELKAIGPMTTAEKRVLIIFICVCLLWITHTFWLDAFIPGLDDTVIAMLGALALFIIPSAGKGSAPMMNWHTTSKMPWSVVLLFGAGFAIAESCKTTGIADWLGEQLSVMEHTPILLILATVVGLSILTTEFASNMATISLMVPILDSLSKAIDQPLLPLLWAATLASSWGFMMPAGTGPNAVVFGSGYLKVSDMIRAGAVLNVLALILITLACYFVLV